MLSPADIRKKRNSGDIRYSYISDYSGSMSEVLGKFGLRKERSDSIHECTRQKALEILVSLLSQDMAYGVTIMPKRKALSIAKDILSCYEHKDSKFYTNSDSDCEFMGNGYSFSALTDSTFDSGVIIEINKNHFFCIWFEDED